MQRYRTQGKRVFPAVWLNASTWGPAEGHYHMWYFTIDSFLMFATKHGNWFYRPGSRYILTRNFNDHIVRSFGTQTCLRCRHGSRIDVTSKNLIAFSVPHHYRPTVCATPFQVYGMCISGFFQGAAGLLSWTAAQGGSSTSPWQMIKAGFCLLVSEGAGGSLVNTTTRLTHTAEQQPSRCGCLFVFYIYIYIALTGKRNLIRSWFADH